MTATTYWISNLFIHYWQRPESFWFQSRNHLVLKDIMCINEIFWWLAIFSHFMTFHHVKLVWKSIMKRNRTPYNRANIMPYESVQARLNKFVPFFRANISNNKAWNPIKLGVKWKLWFSTFWGCPFIWDLDLNCPRYARKYDISLEGSKRSFSIDITPLLKWPIGKNADPKTVLRVLMGEIFTFFLICEEIPNQILWVTKYLDSGLNSDLLKKKLVQIRPLIPKLQVSKSGSNFIKICYL